ncbi:MAG: hypothetical protein NTW86_26940 [Candidatus Sumerlaeota bacterium]|nr:hypothetical protein [Candidatus Sumerlaeota bacterium]
MGELAMSLADPDLPWRVRFGQIFAARLEAEGLDARDWLWFHPSENALRPRDENPFELLDLRRHPERWQRWFAPAARPAAPDFTSEALPFLRERFLLLLLGGFGSHLVASRILEELNATQTDPPWFAHVDYGNTLSSNVECARRAAKSCRALLRDLPGAAGKRLLFLGHSKGANIILELLTDPAYGDVRERTWGAIALAGALGGSPAADSLIARAVRRSRGAPALIRKALGGVGRLIARCSRHPLLTGLPSLADLPDGAIDLSQKRRHAYLNRLTLPEEIQFFSLAAAIERRRARPERFLSRDFDRTFLYLATYELVKHSLLNDTQLLLEDAKWPPAPNAHHLATLNTDHWGLAYRQVLPGAKPDATPRRAIVESALGVIYEG